MFNLLVFLPLLIYASLHKTYLENIRSGFQTLSINKNNQQQSFPVTYRYRFKEVDQFTIKIVIGWISLENFQKQTTKRKLIFKAENANLISFQIYVKHNYPSKLVKVSFMAILQSQISDLKIIQELNVQNPSVSTSMSIGNSRTLNGINPNYIPLVWIKGYQVKVQQNFQELKYAVCIKILEQNTYQLIIKNGENTNLFMISSSILFFLPTDPSLINVSWGWKFASRDGDNRINDYKFNGIQYHMNQIFGLNYFSMQNTQTNSISISEDESHTISCTAVKHVLNYTYFDLGQECPISCQTCDINFKCIRCNQQYLKESQDNLCQCPIGSSVNQISYYCQQQEDVQCFSQETNRFYDQESQECKCKPYLQTCQQNTCHPLYCYYLQQHRIILSDISKYSTQNKLFIIFQVQKINNPYVSSLDYKKILTFQFPQTSQWSWSSFQNGTFFGNLTFIQNIHGLKFNVIIDISQLKNQGHYNIYQNSLPINQSYSFLAKNGLLSNAYSPSIYQQKDQIKNIIYGMLSFSYFIMILGIVIKNNLVFLQMFGVLQISYFGLAIAGQYRSPLIIPLYLLKYFNGYNLSPQIIDTALNLSLIRWSSSVVNNINIMLILILIPFVLAFICFVLSFVFINYKQKFIQKLKQFCGEYLFLVLIFLTTSESFAFGVFIKSTENLEIIDIILSSIQIVIFFILLGVVLRFYSKLDYQYFGQFKYAMKTEIFNVDYFYILQVLERILIGFSFGIENNSYIPAIISIILIICNTIVIVIKRPYAQKFSNARVLINYLFYLLLMVSFIYLNFEEQTTSTLALYMPYIILTIDILCIVVGFIFISKKVIVSILKYFSQKQQIQKRQIEIKVQEINKHLLETLQKGLSNKSVENYAHRLMHMKLNKRKKSIMVKDTILQQQPQRQIDLTLQKFKKVDQMLKDGLV